MVSSEDEAPLSGAARIQAINFVVECTFMICPEARSLPNVHTLRSRHHVVFQLAATWWPPSDPATKAEARGAQRLLLPLNSTTGDSRPPTTAPRKLQDAPLGPRTPRESPEDPGSPRNPQEAPESPREPKKANPRTPQEASGGDSKYGPVGLVQKAPTNSNAPGEGYKSAL